MLSVLMLKLATGQDRAWILRAAGDGMAYCGTDGTDPTDASLWALGTRHTMQAAHHASCAIAHQVVQVLLLPDH